MCKKVLERARQEKQKDSIKIEHITLQGANLVLSQMFLKVEQRFENTVRCLCAMKVSKRIVVQQLNTVIDLIDTRKNTQTVLLLRYIFAIT